MTGSKRLAAPQAILAAALVLLPALPVRGGEDAPPPDTGPRLRVNQIGYLPGGPKAATLVTGSETPLGWTLNNASGTVIASGDTVPRGTDISAGLNVQTLDFSEVRATGRGFTLTADGQTSYPFAIGKRLYDGLAVDALSFFYPMRSGIAIEGPVAGPAYARPAGHVAAEGGSAVNRGDRAVPCQSAAESVGVYADGWTCTYRRDVTGGWYDAGDQGKYVVTGALAAAQLMAAYEHAGPALKARLPALGDGGLRVPEAGNGVPDILDEARWELEWMLKMIVPDGEPLAGLVHHKVHDLEWTRLPMRPDRDPQPRRLHRPSTAATLDLAAAAAIGARVYRPFDPAFAARLQSAAEATWAAALAYPNIYAPGEDDAGGRAYADSDVTDELYWAAAELYITTEDESYRTALQSSKHWTADDFASFAFDWAHVAGFARVELAVLPSNLPADERAFIVKSVTDAADSYVSKGAHEPFGQPYAPAGNTYARGSNHLVLDNALVIAAAYALTGTEGYRTAAIGAMDYVLGRNALDISYVTGYGTRYAGNQHSRWFAHALDPGMPRPPKGALAGGPNSAIEDPVARRLFGETGCAPQTCYVDVIMSRSTNEIAIGWNAALARMAVVLAGLGPD